MDETCLLHIEETGHCRPHFKDLGSFIRGFGVSKFAYHGVTARCPPLADKSDQMTAKEGTRADSFEITGIASPCRGDGTYIMSPGVYGPQTLIKEVLHYTQACPECGTEGWFDHHGEAVCGDENCGVVISGDRPMMLPEDHFSGRCGDGGTGVPAINDAAPAGTSEPDVQ